MKWKSTKFAGPAGPYQSSVQYKSIATTGIEDEKAQRAANRFFFS